MNRRLSRRKRARHISARVYFMKDRIQKEDVNVMYYPTEKMIGNFVTKPLQGIVFWDFRRCNRSL